MQVIQNIKYRLMSPEQKLDYYKRLGVKMGENCSIVGKVDFGSEPYLIKLGNDVRISNNVSFVTHDGGVHVLRNLGLLENSDKFGTIEIKNNVFIGMNALIMPGVTIGNNCVIGAGSIVTKNIPDNCVYAGIPAKKIKSIDDYFNDNKLKVDFTKNLTRKQKKDYLLKKFNIHI